MKRFHEMLAEAEFFISLMPTDKVGLIFLNNGVVVQPDPGRLREYETHAGQNRGHWPTNPDISAAMFE